MFVRDIIINAFIVSFKLVSRIESRIIYLFIRLFIYLYFLYQKEFDVYENKM